MKESALVVLLLLLSWEGRSGLNAYKKSENRPSSLKFINGDTKLVNKLSSQPHSIVSKFQHELERKAISESPPAEDVPSLPPYDLLPKQPTAENSQPSSCPTGASILTLLPSESIYKGHISQNDSILEPLAQQKSVSSSISRVYDSKLFAEDGNQFEFFGNIVLSDRASNLIAVTAPNNGVSGRVFLFAPVNIESGQIDNKTYKLHMEIRSPTEGKLDGFGSSIGLSNQSLLIGSSGSGIVYVYTPDSVTGEYAIQQVIKPKGNAAESNFGCSISVHGDNAIIGSSGDSTRGFKSGAAYIYNRGIDGLWTLSSKIYPDQPMNTYEFGRVVKISSFTVAVSAYFYTDGVVYMYHASSSPLAKYHPSQEHGDVSYSVLTDDIASNKDKKVNYLNLVSDIDISEIIFAPELHRVTLTWKFECVLLSKALYPQQPLSFGHSIHVTDDLAFVSSYAEDGSGEVSVFERLDVPNLEEPVNWINTVKLTASTKSFPGDQFGYSISSRDSDKMILIGAPAPFQENQNSTGTVYLFSPKTSKKNKSKKPSILVNSAHEKDNDAVASADYIFPTTGSSYFDCWGLVATLSGKSTDQKSHEVKSIKTNLTLDSPNITKEASDQKSHLIDGTRRKLEGYDQYSSETMYEVSNEVLSLSFGTSVSFFGDVILVGAKIGHGISNYTGVVYVDNNIKKYAFEELDQLAGSSSDDDNSTKSEKRKEALSSSQVGISMLVAIPIISLAVFFLFCANYNKVLCEHGNGINALLTDDKDDFHKKRTDKFVSARNKETENEVVLSLYDNDCELLKLESGAENNH